MLVPTEVAWIAAAMAPPDDCTMGGERAPVGECLVSPWRVPSGSRRHPR
jgi:hypothetical protein